MRFVVVVVGSLCCAAVVLVDHVTANDATLFHLIQSWRPRVAHRWHPNATRNDSPEGPYAGRRRHLLQARRTPCQQAFLKFQDTMFACDPSSLPSINATFCVGPDSCHDRVVSTASAMIATCGNVAFYDDRLPGLVGTYMSRICRKDATGAYCLARNDAFWSPSSSARTTSSPPVVLTDTVLQGLCSGADGAAVGYPPQTHCSMASMSAHMYGVIDLLSYSVVSAAFCSRHRGNWCMSGKRTDALFNEAQALLQAQIGANRRATTTMPTDPTPAMCTDKCQSYGGILAGMMAQSYNQYQALDAWLNNGGPTPYTPIKNALERTIEEADLACARDTDGTLCGTKLFQQKAALQALPCHVPTAVSLDSSHGTCNATCSAGLVQLKSSLGCCAQEVVYRYAANQTSLALASAYLHSECDGFGTAPACPAPAGSSSQTLTVSLNNLDPTWAFDNGVDVCRLFMFRLSLFVLKPASLMSCEVAVLTGQATVQLQVAVPDVVTADYGLQADIATNGYMNWMLMWELPDAAMINPVLPVTVTSTPTPGQSSTLAAKSSSPRMPTSWATNAVGTLGALLLMLP